MHGCNNIRGPKCFFFSKFDGYRNNVTVCGSAHLSPCSCTVIDSDGLLLQTKLLGKRNPMLQFCTGYSVGKGFSRHSIEDRGWETFTLLLCLMMVLMMTSFMNEGTSIVPGFAIVRLVI